jgi:hypothetical protein
MLRQASSAMHPGIAVVGLPCLRKNLSREQGVPRHREAQSVEYVSGSILFTCFGRVLMNNPG